MGNEAKCRLEYAGKSVLGTAWLETDFVLFRSEKKGELRLQLPFSSLARVTVDGSDLILVSEGGAARFTLGAAAAKWAAKIKSPPSRLDKMGIDGAASVSLVGAVDDVFEREVSARAKSVRKGAPVRTTTVVVLSVDAKAELSNVKSLRAKLGDDAALWVVYPKGQTRVREADVLGAGHDAGLKDVKVARFSETHTALKLVVPRADRKK